jgi:hypothetical protein
MQMHTLSVHAAAVCSPSPEAGMPSAFQMAAVLLTGNGVVWQLFNSVWGSLPFRCGAAACWSAFLPVS